MHLVEEGLFYSTSDEWVKIEGEYAIVGLTDYAQKKLGDVVSIEMREAGEQCTKGETLTVVDSVKSASDIFSPVSGKIITMNEELEVDAGIINQDPYGKGWIVKIELSKPEEVEHLMDAGEYNSYRQE